MTARPSVAIATCTDLPDLDPDDQLLLKPLAEAGVAVTAAVWDDPAVDWPAYDLVVLRNTWDYAPRRDQFVAWAASVPRLANPAEVVTWTVTGAVVTVWASGEEVEGAKLPSSLPL